MVKILNSILSLQSDHDQHLARTRRLVLLHWSITYVQRRNAPARRKAVRELHVLPLGVDLPIRIPPAARWTIVFRTRVRSKVWELVACSPLLLPFYLLSPNRWVAGRLVLRLSTRQPPDSQGGRRCDVSKLDCPGVRLAGILPLKAHNDLTRIWLQTWYF